MNTWRYKELMQCFKSERHALRFIRLLGKRAFYAGGFKKIIRDKKIARGINAGKSDKEIADELDIDRKTVYRQRLIIFKRKK